MLSAPAQVDHSDFVRGPGKTFPQRHTEVTLVLTDEFTPTAAGIIARTIHLFHHLLTNGVVQRGVETRGLFLPGFLRLLQAQLDQLPDGFGIAFHAMRELVILDAPPKAGRK